MLKSQIWNGLYSGKDHGHGILSKTGPKETFDFKDTDRLEELIVKSENQSTNGSKLWTFKMLYLTLGPLHYPVCAKWGRVIGLCVCVWMDTKMLC